MSDIRGELFSCSSVKEIDKCLKQNIGEGYENRNDILYTFDVDDTLIKLNHPLVQYLDRYGTLYKGLLEKYHRITEMDLRRCLAPYVELTELGASEWLKSLKGKKIALTASPTGKCADGTLMTKYRYQELKERDITFEETFNTQSVVLNELTYKGQCPTYYNGILFSLQQSEGSPSKGTVLCAFLKAIDYTPKCVMFVDDRKENLESVQTELGKQYSNTINFIGILYTGAKNDKPSDNLTEDEFKKNAEDLFKECCRKFNIPEPK